MSKKREKIVERIFELAGEEMYIDDFLDLAKMLNKELVSKYEDVVNGTYSYYEDMNKNHLQYDIDDIFTDKELKMIGVKKLDE